MPEKTGAIGMTWYRSQTAQLAWSIDPPIALVASQQSGAKRN
jgi:hypothetical protein